MARVIEWSQLAWGAHPCEGGASESIGDTDTLDSRCFLNYNILQESTRLLSQTQLGISMDFKGQNFGTNA